MPVAVFVSIAGRESENYKRMVLFPLCLLSSSSCRSDFCLCIFWCLCDRLGKQETFSAALSHRTSYGKVCFSSWAWRAPEFSWKRYSLCIEKIALLCFKWGIMLVLYFVLFVLPELCEINRPKSAYSSCNLVNSVLSLSVTSLNVSYLCVWDASA